MKTHDINVDVQKSPLKLPPKQDNSQSQANELAKESSANTDLFGFNRNAPVRHGSNFGGAMQPNRYEGSIVSHLKL